LDEVITIQVTLTQGEQMFDDDPVDYEWAWDTESSDPELQESEPIGLTVASDPPKTERPPRRGWWPYVFAEGRRFPGQWRLIRSAWAESTARQLASDIRCAHIRDPKKMRIRGIAPGERWETRVAPSPYVTDQSPENTPYWIWIRFIAIADEAVVDAAS
jgi:hypothetical protein